MITSKDYDALKARVPHTPPNISFEVFPPKTDEGIEQLKRQIDILATLDPKYISVTYGAGGSTKDKTKDIVSYIKEQTSITPIPHLTCVNATQDEINTIAQEYLAQGIHHIVALRGDMPNMEGAYAPTPEGYAYADDLVNGLQKLGDFNLFVAGYPETHPQARSEQDDLDHLKRKMDAGAHAAILQYCFDTDRICSFIDKAKAQGITFPIIPGIVVIKSLTQIVNFSKRCGANIPAWLKDYFPDSLSDEEVRTTARYIALKQCIDLIDAGHNSFHFYSLNDAAMMQDIHQFLFTTHDQAYSD